jgi:DNA gyrase subunit A
VSNVRTTGRATQGVRFINLDKKQDAIASVTKVLAEQIEDQLLETGSTDIIDTDNTPSEGNNDN